MRGQPPPSGPPTSDEERAVFDSWIPRSQFGIRRRPTGSECCCIGWVVEEGESFLHGPVGFDDEAGDPVVADYELADVSRLLGCEAVKARVV